MRELIVGPTKTASEDRVAGEAIRRFVHLAGTDDDELFELGRDGARVENGAEVSLHGGEDLGPVRHHPEHVGDVATLGKNLIEEGLQIGCDLGAIETGDTGHGVLHGLSTWYYARRLEGARHFDAKMLVC